MSKDKKPERHFYISGMINNKITAAIYSTQRVGLMLADLTKQGFVINTIFEVSCQEKQDFVNKMNEQISVPKKKIIV